MHLQQQLRDLAEAQDGVISLDQARAGGLSDDAVHRRTRSGEWRRILPAVYTVTGRPPGPAGRVRAASMWAGAEAVVAGPAALWWFQLTDEVPEIIDLHVPAPRSLSRQPGIRLHRSPLERVDQRLHRGIFVASPAHAVLFGSAALGAAGRAAVDRALLRLTDPRRIRETFERNLGRHGTAQARQVLSAVVDATGSEAERQLVQLLRSAGITGWTANRTRKVGRRWIQPDFTFERERVIVEVDGFAFHSDPTIFTEDRARQNQLVLAGWRVLRFTWSQLIDHPDQVIAEIRAALA